MGSLSLHREERYACIDLPENEAVEAMLLFRSLIFGSKPEGKVGEIRCNRRQLSPEAV
jgi:hypothetical protein